MHAHYDMSEYLRNLEDLFLQTSRFLALHPHPVAATDVYQSSDLLPLEILAAPDTLRTTHTCSGCHRDLCGASFVHTRGSGGAIRRQPLCKVCNILRIRESLPAQCPDVDSREVSGR